jgi:signal transduction histidine kinase
MEPELGPEGAAVDAALDAWRRKAANILLTAAAAVQLPALVLLMLGYGPLLGPPVKAVVITVYLVLATAALSRPINYRTRLSGFFFATYVLIAAANLVLPHGPYAQVGLVTMPVLILVLLGAPAARIGILASASIIVSAPWLRVQPGVVRMLAIDPAQVVAPPGVVWMQAAALSAMLAAQFILLDRFQHFLLDTLAQRIAAQRKVAHEMRERQRLEREMAGVSDGERRRLGSELHDGVCQLVAAALLHTRVLGRRWASGGSLSGGDFQELSSLLEEAIGDARNIARGLCPLDPDPEALAEALRALAKRTDGIAEARCEFIASGDVRAPDPVIAQHLYRIAQEAVSNAVRHAHASRISIELRGSADELLLRVEDDGVGLPAVLPPGGMGLRTMAYRAQILEGKLTAAPASGGGTRVACRVPRLAGAPAAPHHSGDQRWIPAT